jgi:precorrin isomerase
MLKALDFVDRSKIAKVGQPELVRAMHVFTDFVLARFGISKAGLQNAAVRVHQITQDPTAMAKLNMKAGFTRHPMAASPTPLPPGPGGLINGPAS